MPRGRSSRAALVVLAILLASVLTGCGGGEGAPSSAAAPGDGTLGALVRQVSSEGGEVGSSESELKELIDRETTPEEREQAREALEAEQESEAEAEQEPEAEQETEAEPESEAQ